MKDWKREWVDYIKLKGWKYREATGAFVLPICPKCGEGKSGESSNNFYAYFHGGFKCHKCKYTGNLYTLKGDQGDVKYKPKTAGTKVYRKIDQSRIEQLKRPQTGKERVYEWFEKERKITKETLDFFQIGYDEKRRSISFPYFLEGELVNVKYRSRDKKFSQEANARAPFFNIDNIDPEKPVILAGGETDCMTFWQYGFKNVVSVPCGETNFDSQELLPYLEKCPKVLISFDMDSAGHLGTMQAINKIGSYRCVIVRLPHKDCNECLQKDLDAFEIAQALSDAKPLPDDNVRDIVDFEEDLVRKYGDESEEIRGTLTGWDELDNIIGGIRRELIVVTGHTNQGKTPWLLELSNRMYEAGRKPLVCSFENQPDEAVMHVLSCRAGQDCIGKAGMIRKTISEIYGNKYYFLNMHGATDWRIISDSIKYSIYQHGVDCIFLDNLQFLAFIEDERRERKVLEDIILGCDKIVTEEGVTVVLVSHPRLVDMGVEVTGDHCKGSSAIRQVTQTGITIRREWEGEYNSKWTVWKNRRNQGKLGQVLSNYKIESFRFEEYEAVTQEDYAKAVQDNKRTRNKGKTRQLEARGASTPEDDGATVFF